VAAQDRQAFEALYRRYAPRLHGYLWKLLRRREVVEEIVDDVMVVIWKGSAKFNFTSRLSTWIFGIAHNMALKAFRKYPREPAGLSAAPEEAIDEGATDAPVLRHELRAAVARALQTLPPRAARRGGLTFCHGHSSGDRGDRRKPCEHDQDPHVLRPAAVGSDLRQAGYLPHPLGGA
jgi:RNA polymerase sigma-70 factor (ECF subfamily)